MGELQAVLLDRRLPRIDRHNEWITRVRPGELELRLPFREEFLGEGVIGHAGGLYSGPMMMALADTAMYACIVASAGKAVTPLILTINCTFPRSALPGDLVAKARILRLGKRQVSLDAYLFSDGEPEPRAHVTAMYGIRPEARPT
jgi:uncharacterized protein (TIGR00369 family)